MEQGFIIDRLTNSILNTVSGDSFQTEVIRLGKSDLKHITKNKGWNFNWKEQYDEIKKEFCKLTIVINPNIIQGLLSVTLNIMFLWTYWKAHPSKQNNQYEKSIPFYYNDYN